MNKDKDEDTDQDIDMPLAKTGTRDEGAIFFRFLWVTSGIARDIRTSVGVTGANMRGFRGFPGFI